MPYPATHWAPDLQRHPRRSSYSGVAGSMPTSASRVVSSDGNRAGKGSGRRFQVNFARAARGRGQPGLAACPVCVRWRSRKPPI